MNPEDHESCAPLLKDVLVIVKKPFLTIMIMCVLMWSGIMETMMIQNSFCKPATLLRPSTCGLVFGMEFFGTLIVAAFMHVILMGILYGWYMAYSVSLGSRNDNDGINLNDYGMRPNEEIPNQSNDNSDEDEDQQQPSFPFLETDNRTKTTLPHLIPTDFNESDELGNSACTICLSKPKQCVNTPCGHVLTCVPCAHQLILQYYPNLGPDTFIKCTVCQKEVTHVIRLYDT